MISGVNTTNNVLSNGLVIDMEDKIHLLKPEESPLATLLGASSSVGKQEGVRPGALNGLTIQTGTAESYKHEWLEDELSPRTDAINFTTTYSTVATTFVVDNGAYFVAGQVIFFPRTKEVCRVTGVSSNTLTVTRNLNADANGFQPADNDEIVILGDAEAEGATSPTANTVKKTAKYNYTQIFRRSVEITGTLAATKAYGGNDLQWQRKKSGIDHMRDMERSFFFGQRNENTGGSTPVRTMGGIQYYVTTNVTDVSAALTEATLITFIRTVMTNGAGPKMLFCAPAVLDAIAGFARGKLLTSRSDQTYGLNIVKYVTPHGDVMLVRQPIFSGSTTGIGGYAVCLDMENIQMFYLQGRAPKLLLNRQANDYDGQKDEYLTEATLAVYNEKQHGYMKNITG